MTKAEIYLAGGCFWGTEHYLKQIKGVTTTTVGFANGHTEQPSYQEVCTDTTGHAETVKVEYDADVLPLSLLLHLYFKSIDPTSLNRQGHDVGTQYRTGIYYTNPADRAVILGEWGKLQLTLEENIAVEVQPLQYFWPAEDYHQDYLDKNPTGYCHLPGYAFNDARRANAQAKSLDAYLRPTDEELRERLTPLQWSVTQEEDTEPPFDNAYDQEHRTGIYVDITTGQPLFLSTDKWEAGCGWPAFSKPIDAHLIEEREDHKLARTRTEVRAASSGAHLGHVFTDGRDIMGGLRYCINSAALRFVPYEDMEREGYGALKQLLE